MGACSVVIKHQSCVVALRCKLSTSGGVHARRLDAGQHACLSKIRKLGDSVHGRTYVVGKRGGRNWQSQRTHLIRVNFCHEAAEVPQWLAPVAWTPHALRLRPPPRLMKNTTKPSRTKAAAAKMAANPDNISCAA